VEVRSKQNCMKYASWPRLLHSTVTQRTWRDEIGDSEALRFGGINGCSEVYLKQCLGGHVRGDLIGLAHLSSYELVGWCGGGMMWWWVNWLKVLCLLKYG
jgi:hypothetical protein